MNSAIFTLLDIEDIHSFCSTIYGYEADIDLWPTVMGAEDDLRYAALTRVVIALFERLETLKTPKKLEDLYPDSLYKVGDKVTIRKEYLPGTTKNSYLCGLTPVMLATFGGKTLTVQEVCIHDRGPEYNLHHECYIYRLSSMNCVKWSAEMFKETILIHNPHQNMSIDKKDSDIIFKYKDVVVSKTGEVGPPLDTKGYNVGDIVNHSIYGKTCILGFSINSRYLVIYTSGGWPGVGETLYTAFGERVTFSGSHGTYVSYSEISKAENLQDRLICPNAQATNAPAFIQEALKRNYNIKSSISTIKITIPKNKYHI